MKWSWAPIVRVAMMFMAWLQRNAIGLVAFLGTLIVRGRRSVVNLCTIFIRKGRGFRMNLEKGLVTIIATAIAIGILAVAMALLWHGLAVFCLVYWLVLILLIASYLIAGRGEIIIRPGPAQSAALERVFSFRKLKPGDNIAFHGEAGWQGRVKMPGVGIVGWPVDVATTVDWPQVDTDEFAIVISQFGEEAPAGAKSARWSGEMADLRDIELFIKNHGQRGLLDGQLSPGFKGFIHPFFLVVTSRRVFGMPIQAEHRAIMKRKGYLEPQDLGYKPDQLKILRVEPGKEGDGTMVDTMAVVTINDGLPLSHGIAYRRGGWDDIGKFLTENPDPVVDPSAATEKQQRLMVENDYKLIAAIFQSTHDQDSTYQDLRKWHQNGGQMGMQMEPALYGTYTWHPLASHEIVRMLDVKQGQAAAIRASVGLISPESEKKTIRKPALRPGEPDVTISLVRPGYIGIWRTPLLTRRWGINPRCFAWDVWWTTPVTLNWSEYVSPVHGLDGQLNSIDVAVTKDGFNLTNIELEVQIQTPEQDTPEASALMGSQQNLVNEVLQPFVGRYIRQTVQSMSCDEFYDNQNRFQNEACRKIGKLLAPYFTKVLRVLIRNVDYPEGYLELRRNRGLAILARKTLQAQIVTKGVEARLKEATGQADKRAALGMATIDAEAALFDAKALTARKGADADIMKREAAALTPGGATVVRALKERPTLPQVLAIGGSGAVSDLLGAGVAKLAIDLSKKAPQEGPPAPPEGDADQK